MFDTVHVQSGPLTAHCMNNSNNNNNNNNNNITGTVSKSFRKCVSNIPGKHEVREAQGEAQC